MSPDPSTRAADAADAALRQCLDALERANEVRIKRAQLKRDLNGGRRTLESVLRDPPDYVLTAKIIELLLVLPRYGRVRVDQVLADCGIATNRRVEQLSDAQRAALVAGVIARAPRRRTAPARGARLRP